jgi:hypothetical protein
MFLMLLVIASPWSAVEWAWQSNGLAAAFCHCEPMERSGMGVAISIDPVGE